MIDLANSQKCFCTLALGDNYCTLALELAKDIEKYAPTVPFVVLTDKPKEFNQQGNVMAFKHRQKSVGCYHDKRFVIAKAISLFNSCIFIDADMRILAPVPQQLNWLPGITAKTVWTNIIKHNKNKSEIQLLNKMAKKLNLNLENISFVHECLFVVTRDSGKENEFLKQWEIIAPFFELNGFCRGEGHTIGLAAAKTEFLIRQDSMKEIVFFKDKIELQKIKKGEVDPNESLIYLENQKLLEYPKHSILNRLVNKLYKFVGYLYRLGRLRITSLKKREFYYK